MARQREREGERRLVNLGFFCAREANVSRCVLFLIQGIYSGAENVTFCCIFF